MNGGFFLIPLLVLSLYLLLTILYEYLQALLL